MPTFLLNSLLRGILTLSVFLLASAVRAEEIEPLDCVTAPARVVEVTGARSGLLDGVFADRGDRVTRGMTIATLESTVEAATVRLARARSTMRGEVTSQEVNLSFDQRKQRRVVALHTGQAISEQVKEDAERDAALAGASLQHAREKRRVASMELARAEAVLAQRNVIAPLDGVVTHRFRSAGEYVEDEPILRIAQLDPLHVELLAPVALAGRIRRGMPVKLTLEVADPGGVTGVVVVTDPVADAASGTFGVRIRVPNPEHRLMAGLKCQATIRPLVVAADSKLPLGREPAPVSRAAMTSDIPQIPDQTPGSPESATDSPPVHAQPPAARAPSRAPVFAAASAPASFCATAGPIADDRQAEVLSKALEASGIAVDVRTEGATRASSFIVLAGPGRDLAEARSIAAELRRKGERDLQIMRRGDFVRHVSLGVYDGMPSAEARRNRLARKGIETTIRPRRETRAWLDLTLTQGDGDLASLERQVRAVAPRASTMARACEAQTADHVAAASVGR